MNIKIVAKEPHTTLEIGTDSDDSLCLSASFRGREYHLSTTVLTRDLIMAIKVIEEERDAKHAPAGSTSPEPGSPDDDSLFERTLREAEDELGSIVRSLGVEYLYFAETASLYRSLYRATSPKEIRDFITGVKEKHPRPDRPETRSKPVDDLALEAESEKRFRETIRDIRRLD